MNLVHQLELQCEGKDTIKIVITQKQGQKKKRKIKTWTSKQDQKLIELYNIHPKKWTQIAGMMNERNENQCLHRYRRLLKTENGERIWSEEEDQMVIGLIKKFGKNWKLISQVIKTKNGKQIRERYINKLDPKINLDEWTEQEDLLLISLYVALGSKWSQIAKKLPGRPQNRIKNRFYSYIKRVYNVTDTSGKFTMSQDDNTKYQLVQRQSQNTKVSEEICDKSVEMTDDALVEQKSSIFHGQNQILNVYSPHFAEVCPLDFLTGFGFTSVFQ